MGEPNTIRNFVELMASKTGSSSRLNFGALPLRPNDIESSKADVSSLNAIGWKPVYTHAAAIANMISKDKIRFK
jgi:nucleoside-diphosphate-sugar epimerase